MTRSGHILKHTILEMHKNSYMYMLEASDHLLVTFDWSPVQIRYMAYDALRGRCH